eukprot:6974192-Prymnesium_polylepis.1
MAATPPSPPIRPSPPTSPSPPSAPPSPPATPIIFYPELILSGQCPQLAALGGKYIRQGSVAGRSACHKYHQKEVSGKATQPDGLPPSSPAISISLHPIGGVCILAPPAALLLLPVLAIPPI